MEQFEQDGTPPHDPELSRDTLYQQLATRLRTEIQDGTLPPGSQIPTENALMERFHVSRQTVRNAMAVLRTGGLIYSIHGSGSFVREESPRTLVHLRTDADPWSDLVPTGEPECGQGYVGTATADLLGVGRYERLHLLSRAAVSRTTGQPVLTTRAIPAPSLAGLDPPVDPFADRTTLMVALSAHYGPLAATEYVGSVMAPGDRWPDLHLTEPTPGLETIRLIHTREGRPLLAETELTVAPALRLAYPLHSAPEYTAAPGNSL